MPNAEPLSLFAVAAPGLEALVAGELNALGIAAVAEAGGAAWHGTLEQLYTANLYLHTASRIIARVGEFRARTFFELERHARKLPWEHFVAPGGAVRLRVTCRKSRLYHEGAVAERMLAAIEHRVGGLGATAAEKGSDHDEEDGDAQLFVVRFLHDRCTVSADTSGALLTYRGYRQALAKAPLRENLAAALLLASGWTGKAPLVDPMCGAGTIAIEAALIARRIAPGLAGPGGEGRHYAFRDWPNFDAALWTGIRERAVSEVLPTAGVPIHASDRDAGAIEAAHGNAARAGVLPDLELAVLPLSGLEPPPGTGWLVTNPPYGVRVGESDALRNLYAALGRVARSRLPGWTVALLSAERSLEAQVKVRFTEVLRTRNGGIPVRVVVGQLPESPTASGEPRA
ncbi:RNA methyltransferase [soil metagenome]